MRGKQNRENDTEPLYTQGASAPPTYEEAVGLPTQNVIIQAPPVTNTNPGTNTGPPRTVVLVPEDREVPHIFQCDSAGYIGWFLLSWCFPHLSGFCLGRKLNFLCSWLFIVVFIALFGITLGVSM